MIRQIVKPVSNDVYFSVPDDYVGKTLEILAFKSEEIKTDSRKDQISLINDLYDVIRVNFTGFVFDRDEANSR